MLPGHSDSIGTNRQKIQEQITGNNRPFGGLCVLLMGDFQQMPPVAGESLMSTVLKQEKLSNDYDKEDEVKSTIPIPSVVGAALFKSFQLMELDVNVRAANCELQQKLLRRLRDVLTIKNPINATMVKQLTTAQK